MKQIKPHWETEIDKDGLYSLLRLPLMVHATGGQLGAFIDIENWGLYDIKDQIKICARAFVKQNLHCEELDEIADYCISLGIGKEQTLSDEQFITAITTLSENLYVQIYKRYVHFPPIEINVAETIISEPEVEEIIEPEPKFAGTISKRAGYIELMSKPIPLGQTDYYIKYHLITAYQLFGELACMQWFTMLSDEVNDSKAAERIARLNYEIPIIKKKLENGELYTIKPAFKPLEISVPDELITEVHNIIKSKSSKSSRFNVDKLTHLIVYMIRSSKYNNGDTFYRSYGNILSDCAGSYADKKAVCNALGLFVDGLLTDKFNVNKSNLGIFILVTRGGAYTGSTATEYCIKSDYSYLLDL